MVISSREVLTVPNAQGALRFAWSSGGVLFFVKDAVGSTSAWLGMTSGTMKNSAVVATLPAGSSVAPGQPYPSPDGSRVLLAMVGDDGYSQMYVVNVAARALGSLSTRHDAYPMQWLLDGSGLLYIEGNVIQKESSSLNRMNADGSNKKTLVSGATL
jgi:Tol biopolymer transport system component